jgi:hypothetical protein
VPSDAAVESAQLEPMVRNSPVGAASASVGGGHHGRGRRYEDGFLSLGLALWYGLLAVTYAGQVGLAFLLRERATPASTRAQRWRCSPLFGLWRERDWRGAAS